MTQVEYEQRKGIGYVTLNRPEKLNALSDAMMKDLLDALYALDDDSGAHVGILSGKGRAFCAGADVLQRQLRSPEELARLGGPQGRGTRLEDLMFRFTNWKPLIAAVHGHVVGAGIDLACWCELIVAERDTQFQITETPRGLDASPHWAALTQRGAGTFANEVALTGRFWTAQEALDHGVINRCCGPDERLKVAESLASEIMQNPPLAVRAIVETRRGVVEQEEVAMRLLGQPRKLHLTEDFHESALAFSEKRPPGRFVGR